LTKTIGERLGEDLNVGDQIVVVVSGHSSLFKWDHVGAISLIQTLSGVTSLVEVRSGPLEVDIVGLGDLQVVGGEIVLNGRVGFYNISAFTADV